MVYRGTYKDLDKACITIEVVYVEKRQEGWDRYTVTTVTKRSY